MVLSGARRGLDGRSVSCPRNSSVSAVEIAIAGISTAPTIAPGREPRTDYLVCPQLLRRT
ncbi:MULTISPECIES: hypothetical protein [Microbacterium]|uniref:hypothetical protein n=1 Tax=Microbacterium TaxID=33882 RepID=UPI0012947575|nr:MULTISPECIES: hypothetical protein [Microbacterium]